MKRIKSIFYSLFLAAVLAVPMTSCKDYLDKAPGSDITENDVYGDFTSFQGFVEAMYKCIIDPDKCGAWNNYSFADENLSPGQYPFDLGDYWNASTYFYGSSTNATSNGNRDRRIWEYAWMGIRMANQALDHLNPAEGESYFHGTSEEKDLLEGQSLFFRGWFYFEICRFWGGMPYITHAIGASENMTTEEYNRLNFRDTALKMAEDFEKAANLLPEDWDNTTAGHATSGNNHVRINKFHALGYLGKALLYAASPMIQEEATGTSKTCYDFDAELCKRAAEAFGKLIALCEQTGAYQLQPKATYDDIFFRWKNERPGGVEAIMMPTLYTTSGGTRWSTMGNTVPADLGMNSGGPDVPTHNIVKNFYMANGLPIDDPKSEYNEQDPWSNREFRFYNNIIYYGVRISTIPNLEFADGLETGGYRRTMSKPTPTGYYQRKYNGMGSDFNTSSVDQLQAQVPYLRLSDVYLMYAEACNFMTGGGPSAKASSCSLTAVDAVNAVRQRADLCTLQEMEAIGSRPYATDKQVFFDNLIQERAAELFMEGARFCDLRRWNLNYDPKYLDKTALDYDLDADGKPCNFSERVVITRTAAKKHNWLPIQVKYTKIYAGFPQNPGW